MTPLSEPQITLPAQIIDVEALLPYKNFMQAKNAIADLAAIDYFLAKDVISALIADWKTQCEHGKEQAHNILLESESASEQQKAFNNLFHLIMYVSAALRAGHSCAYLSDIADTVWGAEQVASSPMEANSSDASQQGFTFESSQYLSNLLHSFAISADDDQLIVFVDQRLYLRRYFQFEQNLSDDLNDRLAPKADETQANAENTQLAKKCLSSIFPDALAALANEQEVDWQLVAVANALNKNFSVIAGGPGTGKTYTVTKLLAALVMLAKESGRNLPTIMLSAPTGKAAQRLSESIAAAVSQFAGQIDENLLNAIPNKASTLHRLLGVIPNSPNFRHHQDNLLDVDVLLIDEVSMVDLPMFTRVMRALPKHAKVVLLGDADQLPSVAAGSVLADLAPRPHTGYSDSNLNYLLEVTQNSALANFNGSARTDAMSKNSASSPQDHVTFLTKSRRFDGKGLIGRLASAVIKSEQDVSWQLISSPCEQDKKLNNNQPLYLNANEFDWLKPLVQRYYLPIFSCQQVGDAFVQLAKFRLLCATRQGFSGVENLNHLVIEQLKQLGAVATYNNRQHKNSQHKNSAEQIFHGMPIMIGENDYRLGLFNGDVGLIWRHQLGHLMAVFEDENGEYRWVMPSRLPSFEAVYAMTIHKTQGSEFNHVAMVLPTQKDNKLLSRELLYTGITRAKSYISVASNQTVWKNAVATKVVRRSGLSI